MSEIEVKSRSGNVSRMLVESEKVEGRKKRKERRRRERKEEGKRKGRDGYSMSTDKNRRVGQERKGKRMIEKGKEGKRRVWQMKEWKET